MSALANFRDVAPLIERAIAAMLLIDQGGSSDSVRAVDANLARLAKAAALAKIPVIATGPVIPQIHRYAPHVQYVARDGEINVWNNPQLVTAVRATQRWQLIVAGTIADACVVLPSIAAVHDGYQVFAVMDACAAEFNFGNAIALARITQAGVVPTDVATACAELSVHGFDRNAEPVYRAALGDDVLPVLAAGLEVAP